MLAFVGVKFFTIFWFLSHNLDSRCAGKPIKESKDSGDDLLSKKTLSQKIGSLVWHPGPGKVGKKDEKTPPFLTTPIENPTPKTK